MSGNTALQQWVDNGGSVQELAEKLRMTRQGVYYWLRAGIPDYRIAKVARYTGIRAAKLRRGNVSGSRASS